MRAKSMPAQIAFLTCALAAAYGSASATPGSGGTGWRYVTLDVSVKLHPESSRLVGKAIGVVSLEKGESAGPSFVIGATRGETPAIRFTSVKVNRPATSKLNTPFPPHPPAVLAEITLRAPANRGDQLEVEFEFESDGRGYQFVVDPQAAAASWTNAWYPVPLSAKDESFTEVALSTGTTSIEMPIAWNSVTNGALTKRTEERDRATETWTITQPVLRSFAAGPYESQSEHVGGMDVGVFLLSPKPKPVREQVTALSQAIDAMAKRFGPYPYPSYNIAEIPDGLVEWYASSEQGFIMARSEAFGYEGGNLPLFAHEAAHGWWGNLVGQMGPGSIFCSESLAQYSAVIAIEAIEGEDAATEFLRFSREGYNPKQCARGYFNMIAQGHDKPISQLEGGGWEHNLSDAKGHWIYHMLRRRMGEEAFFGALRTIIEENRGKSITLGDMRRTFNEAAADKSLGVFFEQWLDRKGAPLLTAELMPASSSSDSQAEVVITQAHKGKPYHLFVDVRVEGSGGDTLQTVEIRNRTERIFLPVKGKPKRVVLDPHNKLLIWKPEYGPKPPN